MATTPLERLLFLQGGLCFFCSQPLPKAEASVEHLHAVANGGTNHDDNCVACCKAVNRALGSLPLKVKIQVVLNQKGAFHCPNTQLAPVTEKPLRPQASPSKSTAPKNLDSLALVVANLKQRGSSRPRTEKTLASTITAFLSQQKLSGTAADLIAKLVAAGKVSVADGKISYTL
jgi:hypothetical protein